MTQSAFRKLQEQIPDKVHEMVKEMVEYYGSSALLGFEADVVETVNKYTADNQLIGHDVFYTTGGELKRHIQKAKKMPDCTVDIVLGETDDYVLIVRKLKNGDRYEATYTPYEGDSNNV